MDAVVLKKKLVIEVDVISGRMDFVNEDEMTFIEILGALEYAKWMVHKDWQEGE